MSTYGTHQTVQTPALRAQVCPLIVRYLDCVGLLPGLGRQSQRPCPAGVSRVRSRPRPSPPFLNRWQRPSSTPRRSCLGCRLGSAAHLRLHVPLLRSPLRCPLRRRLVCPMPEELPPLAPSPHRRSVPDVRRRRQRQLRWLSCCGLSRDGGPAPTPTSASTGMRCGRRIASGRSWSSAPRTGPSFSALPPPPPAGRRCSSSHRTARPSYTPTTASTTSTPWLTPHRPTAMSGSAPAGRRAA
jgi:hypothetical protein